MLIKGMMGHSGQRLTAVQVHVKLVAFPKFSYSVHPGEIRTPFSAFLTLCL